jgi:hypothetical protein
MEYKVKIPHVVSKLSMLCGRSCESTLFKRLTCGSYFTRGCAVLNLGGVTAY